MAHSLVVTSSGQLYAFGGQHLRSGRQPDQHRQRDAEPDPGARGASGRSGAGHPDRRRPHHSLAVTASGQLYTFGRNTARPAGNATNSGTSTANPTPALAAIPAGTTIDTVATARRASIARTGLEPRDRHGGAPRSGGRIGLPGDAPGAGGTGPLTWSARACPPDSRSTRRAPRSPAIPPPRARSRSRPWSPTPTAAASRAPSRERHGTDHHAARRQKAPRSRASSRRRAGGGSEQSSRAS